MAGGFQAAGPVLVTGASGFIGSAIAAAFRRSGFPVRILVRASSPRLNVDPHDEVMVGDILDRASMAAALRGMRYLVHAAADYRLWAPSPDDIMRTNVEGTRIVMEEALRRASSGLSTQVRSRPSTCAPADSPTKRGRCRPKPPSAPTSAASSSPKTWSPT